MTKTNITPIRKVLISLDRALNDEIITNGGLKLFLAPEYNMEWNVAVTGIVSGVPVNCDKDIKLGDEIAFSYQVIADRTFGKVGEYFMPLVTPSPHKQIYTNSRGWRIIIQMFPAVYGKFNNFWGACLIDKQGEVLDGTQGNESEVERWKSQFSFSAPQDLKFLNLFEFNGRKYWQADLDQVYAKRKFGVPVSISNRVICDPIEIDVKSRLEIVNGKPLPYQDVKARLYDRAKVVSGGGFKKGEIVGFEERFVERYDFWGKKYFLIKENRIHGIYDDNSTIL